MLFPYQDVRPGPTSQTTSVEIVNLVAQEITNVGVFHDVSPADVRRNQERNVWDKTAQRVLREYAELWERLSKV